MVRVNESYFNRYWETITTNNFTGWYEKNRPPHEHLWMRSGPYFRSNLLGLPTKMGCGRWEPLLNLSASDELVFVQTAKPEELESFFSGLFSTNHTEQLSAVRFAMEHVAKRRPSANQ